MSEENVLEYDHDIVLLISTAQTVRDREKKASSINPDIKARQIVMGRRDCLPSFGKEVQEFNL